MAGSLTASVHEHHRGDAATLELSGWLIDFARFVPYPSSPSPYPGMVPLGKRELNPSPFGTWLSTSSPTASLHLLDELNRSDVILSVELGGKVLEEHYISKLNFSWPQMTCVSGFPPRGSRAILVSFKDSADEATSQHSNLFWIQKFALRFSTGDEAVTFVAALKEKLNGSEEAGIQKSETRSEICFQSDYNPENEIIPRATEQEPNMVKPPDSYFPEMLPRLEYQTGQTFYAPRSATMEEPNMVRHFDSYVPQMQPRLDYQIGQTLYPPQSTLTQTPYEPSMNLPPSFSTLLSGCFPNSTLDAGQTIVKQDPDLRSQILKYMEDSSFQDMLQKVERIIDEIGGNWIL
ncbi:unnamed protein product [Thlaspi arvense]|uniref:Poor homologous synapsis 1 PH domain-containing protein n=1 Tax=Thlaspi arvense TaxID=13288 RepID=A0AAU9RHE0_THLAR|nr:unnamed protein product [Thlaspi arvense]